MVRHFPLSAPVPTIHKRQWWNALVGNPLGYLPDSSRLEGIELVCPPDSDALDEAGRAYKDIENVMRYQADLVEPVVKLTPLGVVKG